MRAVLEAAGLRVHVFTSPHLVRFNERIRVAGTLISDTELAALLAEVLDAAELGGMAVSFFEVSTAAAFLAFARSPADAAVIEVGLGGRFDATNVLDAPVMCGIASLGIDHEAFLLAPDVNVPTVPLARIAFEKAGIAKHGVPLLSKTFTAPMNAAIAAQVSAAGAKWLRRPDDWTAIKQGQALVYSDHLGQLKLPLPRLPGGHQRDNAALAVAMLRHQNELTVPDAAFAAIAKANWPARLQQLGAGPLTAMLPRGARCWLDGGHNADAGRALAGFFQGGGRRLHLVIGMLANKHADAIVRALEGQLASITVVPIPGHACHPAEAFAGISAGIAPIAASSVPDALVRLALQKPTSPSSGPSPKAEGENRIDPTTVRQFDPAHDDVLIAGSLYLAGEVLRLNGEIPQ